MAKNEEETTGMDEQEVEARVDGEKEMTPEERAETFADAVTSKVALVKSGEMTLEEFVEGCKAELETVAPPVDNESLGGLGGGSSDFPALDEEA